MILESHLNNMKDLRILIQERDFANINKLSKLDHEEWKLLVQYYHEYMALGLDEGASYMNALFDVNPSVYFKIDGHPEFDCSKDDEKIVSLLKYLNER